MDPITAIGLAIALIKGAIEIYSLIHNHPSTPPDLKTTIKTLMDQAHVDLKQAQEVETALREVPQAP
jgi:hypothetical protein